MENKTSLNRLYVKGLFGIYNYNIVRKKTSSLMIITGPNGFGKTTLLQSIVSVFQYSLSYFLTFPFEEMVFEMEKSDVPIHIVMKQKQSEQRDIKGDILQTNRVEALNIVMDYGDKHYEQTRTMIEVEAIIGELGYERYLDEWIKENKRYSLRQVLDQEDMLEGMIFNKIHIADVISNEHIAYKSDDRREDYESTLLDMQKNMSANAEEFNKAVTDNFAKLVGAELPDITLSEAEIVEFKNTIQQINKHGLCSVNLIAIPNIKTVYAVLGDQINELSKEVLIPLQQYEQAIKNKNLENKHMVVDINGIRFYTNDTNELIPLDSLSSGEKQVVALYYCLCFEESVSMIIVDEPETSWHVSWQVDFLDEMKKLSDTKKCQVLVATHSPYIINKCGHLVTDLFDETTK